MSYSLKNFSNAFYKPVVQTTLGAKYSMLNKKLNLGFKGIFVTDRKANAFDVQPLVLTTSIQLLKQMTERYPDM